MQARNTQYEFEQVQAVTDHLLQRAEDGWVAGYFFNNQLSSIFQPLFDASGRRVAGHSAYIRSKPNRDVVLSPWEVFALASEDTLLVSLDRLCRTLHAINYFKVASGHGSLFVSVQPRLLESVKDDHGLAFENILNLIGIRTSRGDRDSGRGESRLEIAQARNRKLSLAWLSRRSESQRRK